jgi:uroporphyrinogen III methyltransferase/synthase
VTVYLVGAGPGDPGLLTVRGAQVLARADVVVFDRLSVSSLLDLAPAAAERISVGKAPGRAELAQEDINALLVERGLSGQQVVRLKGGDPFVFARGGEEAAALVKAGVAFEVVPGVTSAIAVPAYAGIPVTLRHSSTSFTVVTGHEDPTVGGPEGTVDWESVAKVGGTIVVLMGAARIGQIAARLIAGGRSPETPVASITWGTRPEQQTVRATLATIGERSLTAPATIVIGEVAAQHLEWFESRPLFGRRVVVTRAREQASALSGQLRENGADVIEVPVIAIADPLDGGAALRAAAAAVRDYDWVVLTSANGARRLLDCVRDARALGGVRVAAIGSATAEALRTGNIVADLAPDEFVAEALLDAFPEPQPHDKGKVLLARAEVARDVVPDGLRAKGWDVDVVDAYRTVAGRPTQEVLDLVGGADVVTFTSSSTVDRFLDVVGHQRVPRLVACIGPVTAQRARDRGLHVDVEARVHTIDGLVAALVDAVSAT